MELRTDRFKLKELFPDKAKKFAQKLHIKSDEIDYIRKGIPMEPDSISIEENERAAIRYITTPKLDRDNEILLPDGAILDDFRQSPSVLYAHDYRGLPIGKDTWIKPTKQGILAKTVYANHAFAEDVFQCVKGGFLNSNSVGFIPFEVITQDDKKSFELLQETLEKDYGISKDESGKAKAIYTKWILLEHSDVPVASNAASLNVLVAKGEINLNDRLKKDLGITEEVPTYQENSDQSLIEDLQNEEELNIERNVEVVTKPETTDNYHRIPVSEGHDGHEIKTIDIDKNAGIKALYCVPCKEIKTYLFDVDKFSMEEAQAWVNEHKEGIILVPSETEEGQPAKDVDTFKTWIIELKAELRELKEGRVLSTQNRKLIYDCFTKMRETADELQKLHDATDPASREEEKATTESTTKTTILPVELSKDEIKTIVIDHLKNMNISQAMANAADLAIKKLRGKVE